MVEIVPLLSQTSNQTAPKPPTRPTISRAEAIALHGSHWRISSAGPAPSLREVLGSVTVSGDGDTPDTIEAEAISRRRASVESTRRGAVYSLGGANTKIRIAFARLGLARRRGEILRAVARYKAVIAEADRTLADGGWRPERFRLPERLAVQPSLPVGTVLWEVGYWFPLEHGAAIRRLRVAAHQVFENFRDDGWDFVVNHLTERVDLDEGYAAGTPSFYGVPDGPAFPAPESWKEDSRLFLTREAAASHLLEIAERLEARALDARERAVVA